MRMNFFIASLLSIGICFGSPIRSSIGAAHSRFAQDEEMFDIPYVTDGLVAIWDAEWNAGWGKHDPNGGLVELISKIPTYVRRGTYVVKEDCIKGDNVVIASPPIPAIISMGGGNITIEGCCTMTKRGIFISGGRPFMPADKTMFWSNDGYYMLHGALTESTLSSRWASGFSSTERRCRTLVASEDVVQWWIDGKPDASAPRTMQLEVSENHFSIFGSDWTYSFPESGEFCCLRIYNRALTAEEIEWNFSVDKVRFSLP